ncbi:hypothetical protein KIN20_037743 [Parelaphostrongylus tenuis]|uniref:Uncharacterized protein n=1 Tax=Parelaphostrongylus tenuis TaxID=148309 RepID=A0AAD5REY4_PARTN|nr:hypothetical protein KIN20_037743 [Parelaphostrongylus tenuis]
MVTALLNIFEREAPKRTESEKRSKTSSQGGRRRSYRRPSPSQTYLENCQNITTSSQEESPQRDQITDESDKNSSAQNAKETSLPKGNYNLRPRKQISYRDLINSLDKVD